MSTDPSAVVDLTPFANYALGILASVVSVATPILVLAALKRLGIANAADVAGQVDIVAKAGAGAAYNYALTHEGGLASVAVHSDAIAHGVDYVLGKAPDLLKAANLTPDAVSSMVAARLGSLLATDPTVTAGKPVPGQSTLTPTPAVVPPVP